MGDFDIKSKICGFTITVDLLDYYPFPYLLFMHNDGTTCSIRDLELGYFVLDWLFVNGLYFLSLLINSVYSPVFLLCYVIYHYPLFLNLTFPCFAASSLLPFRKSPLLFVRTVQMNRDPLDPVKNLLLPLCSHDVYTPAAPQCRVIG